MYDVNGTAYIYMSSLGFCWTVAGARSRGERILFIGATLCCSLITSHVLDGLNRIRGRMRVLNCETEFGRGSLLSSVGDPQNTN